MIEGREAQTSHMPGSWYALWGKIKQSKRIRCHEVGSTILDSIVLRVPSDKVILLQKPK